MIVEIVKVRAWRASKVGGDDRYGIRHADTDAATGMEDTPRFSQVRNRALRIGDVLEKMLRINFGAAACGKRQ